ncbi:MAG: prepilin-type N-terminal cleavage/methylation domain-containing protein [Candidatus Omnitrophica bacterium]|nr:prepilin-type N-terminal cleavage/methylation domain-containing protein [Candidatus Omnitrophota bacterium]
MHILEKRGFTFMEFLLVVVLLGIMVGIVVPNAIKIRDRANINVCKNHLRQIQIAKEQWALENNKGDTDFPLAADLDPYIPDETASLYCPLDAAKSFATSYNILDVMNNPSCKIDVSHDMSIDAL